MSNNLAIARDPQLEQCENMIDDIIGTGKCDSYTDTAAIRIASGWGFFVVDEKQMYRTHHPYTPDALLLQHDKGVPDWVTISYDKQGNVVFVVHDGTFCMRFKAYHHLNCINGAYYNGNGAVSDAEIKNKIYYCLYPFIDKGINARVDSLFGALCHHCYVKPFRPPENKIYVADGTTITFDHDSGKYAVKENDFSAITVNRLPVKYDPEATCPAWTRFIYETLSEDDVETLREYLGYLLIPSTRVQKALIIKGNGREGKSVIGSVLAALFGQSAIFSNIQRLDTSPYQLAELENRLVFIDDDMSSTAMDETRNFKQVVSAKEAIQVERKYQKPYYTHLSARIVGFTNSYPVAVNDRSDGFYRRQILLTCKAIPKNRVDDPFLDNKLKQELPGILNWMLDGLQTLLDREFCIYESDKAKATVDIQKANADPVRTFLNDSSWIEYAADAKAPTKTLVDTFKVWCHENAVTAPKDHTISIALQDCLLSMADVKKDDNVTIGKCRRRGYNGIRVTEYGQSILSGYRQ